MNARRLRRLSKTMLLPLVALALLAVPARVAYRSFRSEASFFAGQRHAVTPSANAAGITGLRDVSFRRDDGITLKGWYAPGAGRGTVILAHGSGDDRASLLPEARALAGAGFGVFLFDWPGHGESEGEIQLGDSERRALKSAVDWLVRQDGVDTQRIGALGFSLGGYILAQVAPAEPRLAAVTLIGTPGDLLEVTRFQYRHWGFVSLWPALLADRRGGVRFDEPQPLELVRKMAPRPLLVITGTEDDVVPPNLARELFAALPEPKELWLVTGGQHGNLSEKAPEEYPRRLVEFFRSALQ